MLLLIFLITEQYHPGIIVKKKQKNTKIKDLPVIIKAAA